MKKVLKENDPIKSCKGVGDKTADAFGKLGVESIGGLLMHLPLRYDRFGPVKLLSECEPGQTVSVRATITAAPFLRRSGRLDVLTVSASDGESTFRLVWFNMPYLRSQLRKGMVKVFRGRLSHSRFGTQLEQPAMYDPLDYEGFESSLQPVYGTVSGLTSARIRKTIADTLENFEPEEDFMPDEIRRKYDLIRRYPAIRTMHFPGDEEGLLRARRRMVFEEFLLFILSVRALREEHRDLPNLFPLSVNTWAARLESELPYQLTNAQQKVLAEIRQDIRSDRLMNRLIQGDVGSGKTILAFLALLEIAENGCQGALMAPTEVLARQHYENLTALLEEHGIPCRVLLLTGSMTAAEKRAAYKMIKEHEADIVIGTHALIQDKVVFDRLALVVTDEQHRFGVRQREILSEKGVDPHVIVMSATPIPRTMAIILYGDLDISVLDEIPKDRIPVKNAVVDKSFRAKAYELIRDQVREGHQAYIICPKVEASEESDGENVVDYTEMIRGVFPPGITIEYLHGRMRPKEKNDRMERFAAGEIQVLVSTTVIEVGVDVPNATVMMIEDAESFGLAQLHQLRGRVGRGRAQSYCIFVNGSGDPSRQERLEILKQSNDGFYIASEDLKLRGPGDVFGIRQSGDISFAIGDIFTDSTVLKDASDAADEILAEPGRYPVLEEKVREYTRSRLEHISL